MGDGGGESTESTICVQRRITVSIAKTRSKGVRHKGIEEEFAGVHIDCRMLLVDSTWAGCNWRSWCDSSQRNQHKKGQRLNPGKTPGKQQKKSETGIILWPESENMYFNCEKCMINIGVVVLFTKKLDIFSLRISSLRWDRFRSLEISRLMTFDGTVLALYTNIFNNIAWCHQPGR